MLNSWAWGEYIKGGGFGSLAVKPQTLLANYPDLLLTILYREASSVSS